VPPTRIVHKNRTLRIPWGRETNRIKDGAGQAHEPGGRAPVLPLMRCFQYRNSSVMVSISTDETTPGKLGACRDRVAAGATSEHARLYPGDCRRVDGNFGPKLRIACCSHIYFFFFFAFDLPQANDSRKASYQEEKPKERMLLHLFFSSSPITTHIKPPTM